MVDTKNEIWKEIRLNTNYLVSNLGRVKSKARLVKCKNGYRNKSEHILTPCNIHGYYHVGFNVDGKLINPLVHKLVMEALSEEIKTHPEWEIDHINGNSLDNRFENLQYVSSSENTIRAYNLGLQDKKKLSLSNKKRIATPEQIAYIKHQFNLENRTLGGRKNKDFYERMAIKFGYSDPQSIYRILLGRTNKYFSEDIVQTTKHDALLWFLTVVKVMCSENYSGMMNLIDCQVGIYASLNSSDTMIKQKLGRLLRHPNPVLIIPYYNNTREEEIIEKMLEDYNPELVTVV